MSGCDEENKAHRITLLRPYITIHTLLSTRFSKGLGLLKSVRKMQSDKAKTFKPGNWMPCIVIPQGIHNHYRRV